MVSNLKFLKVVSLMIGIVLVFQSRSFADSAIDLDQARQYFEEARTICESDSGHLWGRSPVCTYDVRRQANRLLCQ
jgi:hypothetical protein